MNSVVSISPFRCRMWAMHDRSESYVTETSCKAVIASIVAHGQLIPVLGRPLRGDPAYEVELIYGARRLFVARHLNKELLVELRDLSDQDAIVAMDIENRQRIDISPHERGLSYGRWLRLGYFQSQGDLARALGVSSSQVSRLLKLARLPAVILGAFNSPLAICEGWGLYLMDALDDPLRRQATLQRARAIANRSPRPPAHAVYRELLVASAHGRKPKMKLCDEVIKGSDGRALFRIKHQRNSIAVVLPLDKVSAQSLNSIRAAITTILQRAAADIPSDSVGTRTHPRAAERASLTQVCNGARPRESIL